MKNVISHIVAVDRKVFTWFNSLAGKSRFFDAVVVMFAEGVVYALASGYIVYILSMSAPLERMRLFVQGVAAVIIARFGLVFTIRILDFRYRPFWYENVTQLVTHNPYEPSFPSGHAAVMGAIVTLMWCLDMKWGIVFAVLALLSGVARVIVGVHFPLDIIIGFACGVLGALIVKSIKM